VHPCLPRELSKLTLARRCRGAEYRIQIANKSAGGAPRLTVEDKAVEGTLVPWSPAGAVVRVTVEM
jgi:cellobiose phosphorylase